MPMDMPKSSPETVALFEDLAPSGPGVERRKMFGYPAAFVNGNHFAGLFGDDLVLRFRGPELEEFLALDGVKPFEPMPGRRMGGYAVAPRALLRDKPALSSWLGRALESVAAMPAKDKKPKKS